MPEERTTVEIGRAAPSAARPTVLVPGDDLAAYRVVRRIAMGGMATVYEGRHRLLERAVALKVAHARDDDGSTHRRFLREARFLSRLDHPGTVEIYDFGHTDDGRPWMAMELLTGATLAELLAGGGVELRRAIGWLRSIAETLAAAHQEGVVHRDLKPDNVFVVAGDRVKVLDWGIAFVRPSAGEERFTQGQFLIGTPQYIAPEQARGLAVDGRADVYSLGIVAYEVLARRVPFDGITDVEIAAQHVLSPPPPLPDVPPRLGELVMSMLAKDPAARPDIEDVERELARLLT